MPLDPEPQIVGQLAPVINIVQNGWTAKWTIATRTNLDTTTSQVIKIIDWFGGAGVKPAINIYVGATDFVSDIDDAVAVLTNNEIYFISITLADLRLATASIEAIYYVTDLSGLFYSDASDTTSVDDGEFTIVTANSKRFKKKSFGYPLTITETADFAKIDSFNSNIVRLIGTASANTYTWSSTGTANGTTVFAGKTGFWTYENAFISNQSATPQIGNFNIDGIGKIKNRLDIGDSTGQREIVIDGGSTNTSDGSAIYFKNGGNNIAQIGNYSANHGGAYDGRFEINTTAQLYLNSQSTNATNFGGDVTISTTSPTTERVLNIDSLNPTINLTGNSSSFYPQLNFKPGGHGLDKLSQISGYRGLSIVTFLDILMDFPGTLPTVDHLRRIFFRGGENTTSNGVAIQFIGSNENIYGSVGNYSAINGGSHDARFTIESASGVYLNPSSGATTYTKGDIEFTDSTDGVIFKAPTGERVRMTMTVVSGTPTPVYTIL